MKSLTADKSNHLRQVLVLSDSEYALPAYSSFDSAFRASLQADTAHYYEFYRESLDVVRFPEERYEVEQVRFLTTKYQDRRMDLIVALGPEALAFLNKYRNTLFRKTPVMSAALNTEQLQTINHPANIRHVVVNLDPTPTLKMALQLQPDVQNLVVIYGASPIDTEWEAYAKSYFQPYAQRLNITYWTGWTLERMEQEIAHLPPRTIVFLGTVHRDGTGKVYLGPTLADRLSRATNAPIYGVYDTYLGSPETDKRGIVGGYITTFERLGQQTARIALQVLSTVGTNGAKAQATPDVTQGEYLVDGRQLQRWSIAESRLPTGTAIHYKEQSLWERYRTPLIATSSALIAQLATIVGLVVERQRRRRMEKALAEKEQWMSFAVDSANLGLLRWDAGNDQIWSTGYCQKMLGLSSPDLSRDAMIGRIHPDDQDRIRRAFEAAVSNGRMFEEQVRISHPDQVRWIRITGRTDADASGKVRQVTGVIQDITEQKRADDERAYLAAVLATEHRRLEGIVDSIPGVVWESWEKADGTGGTDATGFVSDHLENMVGYRKEEWLAHPDFWLSIVHPQDRERASRERAALVARGKYGLQRFRWVARNGEVLWVEVHITVHRDEANDIVLLRGVTTDITGRVLVEETLRRLTGQLLQSQDQERRRIARELHDLTAQNLIVVLFNLGFLDRAIPEQDKKSKDLLADSNALCQQVLEEIRTLSYVLHPPLLDQAGLSAALSWYVDGFSERTGIHVDLNISRISKEERLSLDVETALFRVVQESLTNIHRYSEAKRATVKLTRNEESVMLRITDVGKGISPEKIDPVTGDVMTVGVGIAGMRERIHQLGGQLALHTGNRGTEVIATVPWTLPAP